MCNVPNVETEIETNTKIKKKELIIHWSRLAKARTAAMFWNNNPTYITIFHNKSNVPLVHWLILATLQIYVLTALYCADFNTCAPTVRRNKV